MRQKHPKEGGVPWSIQPELSEGCSMKYGKGNGGLCHFCGLNAIRTGPGQYKFMSIEIATKLADDMAAFCPKARIEFAMRGEPLMNPNHLEIFRIFRERLPKTSMMLTTNGDPIRATPNKPNRLQEKVEKIFEAGVNLIVLDTYYPKERRDDLREQAFALKGITVEDFYDDWLPKGKKPWSNFGNKIQKTIVLMDDLAARNGEDSSRIIKTHAGSNPTLEIQEPLKLSCARPFREMTIAANGEITLCCDDWMHQYVVANIMDMSLEEIWKSPRFEAARARLYHKDRNFGPCAKCDVTGANRFGLLPVYNKATPKQVWITEQNSKTSLPIWKETE